MGSTFPSATCPQAAISYRDCHSAVPHLYSLRHIYERIFKSSKGLLISIRSVIPAQDSEGAPAPSLQAAIVLQHLDTACLMGNAMHPLHHHVVTPYIPRNGASTQFNCNSVTCCKRRLWLSPSACKIAGCMTDWSQTFPEFPKLEVWAVFCAAPARTQLSLLNFLTDWKSKDQFLQHL